MARGFWEEYGGMEGGGSCACARQVAYHISGLAVHKGLHGYEEEEAVATRLHTIWLES